jgi:hypothetical protein
MARTICGTRELERIYFRPMHNLSSYSSATFVSRNSARIRRSCANEVNGVRGDVGAAMAYVGLKFGGDEPWCYRCRRAT